ncbi:hypothetical protein EYF80_037584 [Liparis tanakae]|uniref:Uncharacterized protein n=1 Tax=Liparis tanakae TaxID=230148 RepID=A0A4Z2GFB5_9TELE|nr:hypothetical protein EYF80_037584 [Liparis tanakae]
MSSAKIHDRQHISSFWEQKIHGDTQHAHSEELRKRRSALKKYDAAAHTAHVTCHMLLPPVHATDMCTPGNTQNKLSGEWSVRLDNRTKHLMKVKKVNAESADLP